MKVSVNISEDDVRFIDAQAASGAFSSRSAAIQASIRMLRESRLVDDYAEAFDEWRGSPESALWASTDADGFGGSDSSA